MLIQNLGADFHTDLLLVGNQPGKNFFIKLSDLIRTVYRLITRLQKGHYDVVHVNIPFKLNSLLRDSLHLWMVNRLGYADRTVVFFHGWDGDLAEKLARNPLYRWGFARLYKRVGVIFVLYSRCKDQLINIGIEPQKIKVTTAMYKKIPSHGTEGDLGRKTDEKVNILFMSRFVEGKGVFIAAKVAQLLIESGHRHFRLTLAGDGPLLSELRQFIAKMDMVEYVETPGYVSGRQKEEILERSGIFLFPTQLPEGCPVVILEAMGAGQAVVSTPRGAIPDIIVDGENGLICDSQAPDVFYEAVKKLLDDRELLNKMQKANRKKAEENYEVKDYSRRMEEVYRAIANRKKNAE